MDSGDSSSINDNFSILLDLAALLLMKKIAVDIRLIKVFLANRNCPSCRKASFAINYITISKFNKNLGYMIT